MKKPPLLDSVDSIKEKCNMLGSLLEIQIAYEVIKDDKCNQDDDRDPVDIHYERLMCKMEVVDPESSEFHTIKCYMTNTHGATHTLFDLDVVDIIRIDRAGEKEKFKSEIGNRRLLWHGSSNANYGGILSQGLRIAPPEAPVILNDDTDGLLLLCDVALGKVKEELHAVDHSLRTIRDFNSVQGLGKSEPDPQCAIESEEGYSIPLGKPVKSGYMFGKGVYFADMVSKSANYCRILNDDTDGLLLLCDVALGKVKEELHAVDHSLRTIRDFNSVQGLGKSEPDPQCAIESEEGYSIPLGKPVKVERANGSSLLYNESHLFFPNENINFFSPTSNG
ncbi:Poly(ADP-ribose) polymerase catalytic domain protein [Dictyocaulus viviparus]|uniref:Poly [ADP-ribose] polymerase n=1 Tax=Dictyocaulus viviparus TaxID=29172 RepID=A0A0D8XRH4_DICVI|nr:Poly(ADP-ribose) polymerase catalytic domain protein [Dictyocaulus viviparus]